MGKLRSKPDKKLLGVAMKAARKLKIEEEGDPWKGKTKPKIRLMGRWLEQAGFIAGNHVCVTCVEPGVIELRYADAVIETKGSDNGPLARAVNKMERGRSP